MRNTAAQLSRWLRESPFSPKTYFVGGCVRDELWGRPVKDLDLVVEEKDGAKNLSHYLHAKFPESVSTPHLLGAAYPIWQVVIDGFDIQIADTHKESFPDSESRQRVVEFAPLEEDAARRDFTVNMLYRRVGDGELLDPSSAGLEDIQAKRLRCHPRAQAELIFRQDPLRILRLFRFAAILGARVDEELYQAAFRVRERLLLLSPERVRDEVLKAAAEGRLAEMLEALAQKEILATLFPEILAMASCEQDKIYHSEGDVWTHTLLVMKNSPPGALAQFAALLHDAGKPATRSVHGERVKFLGHELVSAAIARDFLKKWRFPLKLSAEIEKLILLHLRGGDVRLWKSLKPARKLLRDAGEALDALLDLIEADSKSSLDATGQARVDHLPVLRKALQDAALDAPVNKRAILSGNEIMELLAIPSGPSIKILLEALLDAEDEAVAQREAWNKEIAAAWLKQRAASLLGQES
jgi:poly(A) polymerase